MSLVLLSVDPGYDATGFAVFVTEITEITGSRATISGRPRPEQIPLTGNTEQRALLGIVASGAIVPSRNLKPPRRLAELAARLFEVAEEYRPDVMLVETPAIPGTYRRNQASRATLNKLYMALGVTLATLADFGGEVVTRRAGTARKQDRHMVLEQVAKQAGVILPEGPRGGRSGPVEDEWDAIWVGWWAITTGAVHEILASGHAVR